MPPTRGMSGQHRSVIFLQGRPLQACRRATLERVMARLLSPAALVEGVDWHLSDPFLAARASRAQGFALALPPLGNLTNGFYAVHPRRNDRFVVARPPLRALYPEVDFAGFAFTGELLSTLAATCPGRFVEMRRDLTRQWLARVEQLLALMPAHGILLEPPAAPWLSRPPLRYVAGLTRVAVDPDDRQGSVAALLRATRHLA